MKILGLNLSHNASCALVEDGELIFSLENDRLSRKKGDDSVSELLSLFKDQFFDNIIYTSFNLNLRRIEYFYQTVNSLLDKYNIRYNKLEAFPYHHLSHAFSSFYNSSYEECIALVIDNGGMSLKVDDEEMGQEILSIIKINKDGSYEDILKICRNESEKFLQKNIVISLPTISIAGMYEHLKHLFNMKEPGAVMGYSCYGKENENLGTKPFLINKNQDGYNLFIASSLFLHQCVQVKEKIGDIKIQEICFSVQKQTEEIVLHYLESIRKKYGNVNICLSGGLFQNCVLNYKIIKNNFNVFVDPISNDGGTAIGVAQHAYHKISNKKPNKYKNLYLGLKEDLSKIDKIISKNHVTFIEDCSIDNVAKLLVSGKIIGIFQGRSEFGPRALGNRSILFNPSILHGKDKINLIKERAWFRPVAGTVLYEEKNKWFNFYNKESTPFMSYAVEVLEEKQKLISAIVHVDGTCRVQTLKKEENEYFYELINCFYKKTNIPILGNTSLNSAGKPVIQSLTDASDLLVSSSIDFIYFPEINKKLYVKKKK
jgi:carbamoyltransferase